MLNRLLPPVHAARSGVRYMKLGIHDFVAVMGMSQGSANAAGCFRHSAGSGGCA